MRFFGLLALVAVLAAPVAAQEKWRLIWHDEFRRSGRRAARPHFVVADRARALGQS